MSKFSTVRSMFSAFAGVCALLCTPMDLPAQDGLHDVGFGNFGSTQVAANGFVIDNQSMIVMPDGQFAVAGRKNETQQIAVFVFNANGTQASNFGAGTYITTNGAEFGTISLPKLRYDERRDAILIGAIESSSGAHNILLCRVLRDGTMDSQINASPVNRGCLRLNAPTSAPNGLDLRGIGVSRTGVERFYMAGTAFDFSVTDFRQPFLFHISLESSQSYGWAVYPVTAGTSTIVNYAAVSDVDDQGRMFIAGGVTNSVDNWSVVKKLDRTSDFFGSARATLDPDLIPNGYDAATAISFTDATRTRLVVAGESQRNANGATDCTVSFYQIGIDAEDLVHDGAFANGVGYVSTHFTPGLLDSVQCTSVAMDGQGRIYLAGSIGFASPTGVYYDTDAFVARLTPAGLLDTTFGPNGQGYILIENSPDDTGLGIWRFDRAMGLGLTPNGVVTSGTASPINGANVQNTSWWVNGLTNSGGGAAPGAIFANGFE